ncbi:Fumarate lyase [Penicillium nucicola]|uniref:Fumarate lyase n=1 Tax=Penicillium nucicola TaxID=1850975 RepID=UPI0025450F8A|nr:Fumarate lyase [Penicillium nucicola]KAJ5746970.1 Fumarate lyase [Penicillium nucicola]
MAVSALDSRIFRNLFGTQEIRDVFTDKAYVKCLIEVEAALARAEAIVGQMQERKSPKFYLTLNLKRLTEIKERCLLVQFGGAVGTIASLGSDEMGLKVREQLATELGLKNPDISWHVARDNIAEILNTLALVGGTLGKIALDIMIMSSNEFDEVSEPFVPHRGASSTMPQKRNPISSEVILAASKMLRVNASLGLDALITDFERASGPWHLEWVAVPDSFVTAVGALHQTNFVLRGLVVKTDSMKRNLHSTKGLIVGEAVMMDLAPCLGRQNAHDLVYEACKSAIENNRTLLDVLQGTPALDGIISSEKLANLCDPLQYMGASQMMVDQLVQRAG